MYLHYTEILKQANNFIALDISVRSTGWVRYVNKVLTFGTYTIQASTDRERRKEFGAFLTQLVGQVDYDFIVVEDVIFGNNFETTKSLMQLNVVIENLMDDGKISDIPVVRIGNTVWKKRLYQIANTQQGYILKGTDDKERIRDAVKQMGFVANDNVHYAQDIYDAFGIGLVCAFDKYVNHEDILQEKPKKLHTDIRKNYAFVQCDTQFELHTKAETKLKRSKRYKKVVHITDKSEYKDLEKHFKDVVLSEGEDNIFAVDYNLNNVGAVLLTKAFTLSITQERVYFLVYLK